MNLKQKLLIEYLISSSDTYALCSSVIDESYFDPELKNSVKFIKEYYNQYNTTPDNNILRAETNVEFELQDITKDKINYCVNEVERFCKQQAIKLAVLASAELIDVDVSKPLDYGKIEQLIKDAITLSIDKDLGLDYFDDPEERLKALANEKHIQSTGWKTVDNLLYGGISKGELLLFSANSGGGKSLTLANLGLNFVDMGIDVLYLSFELSEELIGQRFDTMISGINRTEWKDKIPEISNKVKEQGRNGGQMFIKYMPSGTHTNHIKSYLKEFELRYGKLPELLLVDYIDLMSPTVKVSADNVFEKDKRTSEELRNLGNEYDMYVATASQLNRSSIEAKGRNHSHIAGGISKINTADVYISIVMDDVMKASGEMNFVFEKTRNSDGVGKTQPMEFVNKFLRIQDGKNDNSIFNPKSNSFNKKLTDDSGDELFNFIKNEIDI